MLNLAIFKNTPKSRAIFVLGPKSDRRWSSSLGYSLSTVEPRRKVSVRSLDIAVEPRAEVWNEDSSRSPELTGKKSQNNFWKESNSAISHVTSAISYDSNPFLSPSNTRKKKCTSFSPKKPKDNKGHSNWREVF